MTFKKFVMNNILIAFNYIDNAHAALEHALKNERNMNEADRNALYSYGLDQVNLDKVRLANVKKSLSAIKGSYRLSPDTNDFDGEIIMDRANEKDHAVGFDYPNGVDPKPYNEIKYGTTKVPRPTNSAAKITPAKEVMRATLEGK
jgi:hypothetical protein